MRHLSIKEFSNTTIFLDIEIIYDIKQATEEE